MYEIKVFENKNFGEIRTINRDGNPWFVAIDVCNALDIGNARDAVGRLDDDEKNTVVLTDGNRGNPNMTIVSEAGLYSLVLGSRKPEAKAFKRWITHDVIPSIRQTGGYIAGQENISDSELLARAHEVAMRIIAKKDKELAEAKKENEKLQATTLIQAQQIAEMQPQVTYYQKVINSKGTIGINVIAKDYDKSAIEMNRLLHEKRVQYRTANGTWVLYQEHVGKGYTDTKTYVDKYGKSHVHTYWTQAGRLFIYDTLKSCGILPHLEIYGDDPTADMDEEEFDIDDIF